MMTTTRLAVPDVSCSHCERAIEGALTPLPGVQRVKVDVRGRVVAVDHDPEQTPVWAIAHALEDEGYPVAGQDDTPGAAA